MVEVEVMPSALEDIKSIIDYVYKQSVQNAEKLYGEIREKISSLRGFPERGSLVTEITSQQLREIRLYHYRIIYRCTEEKVQVLTVHHSARLLSSNPHFSDLSS
jgi:plasmid stabilization system protein ParE